LYKDAVQNADRSVLSKPISSSFLRQPIDTRGGNSARMKGRLKEETAARVAEAGPAANKGKKRGINKIFKG
jgi:hypothetical protein